MADTLTELRKSIDTETVTLTTEMNNRRLRSSTSSNTSSAIEVHSLYSMKLIYTRRKNTLSTIETIISYKYTGLQGISIPSPSSPEKNSRHSSPAVGHRHSRYIVPKDDDDMFLLDVIGMLRSTGWSLQVSNKINFILIRS